MTAPPLAYFRNVFINCPFDNEYLPLFQALVFTVTDCGFIPRCALEAEDSGDVRIQKIMGIIEECCYGIHDISPTESIAFPRTDGSLDYLPRFNMPLELGLFMGAQRFGNKQQRRKNYLVFDREKFRFQKFISDLAGQDIKIHEWPGLAALAATRNQAINRLILGVRNWLTTKTDGNLLPGARLLTSRFQQFEGQLPVFAIELGQHTADLSFYDLLAIIDGWMKSNPR